MRVFLFLIIFVIPGFAQINVRYFASENTDKTLYPIEIGSERIYVEVAKTKDQRIRGLSGRTSMGASQGMIFIFENPKILNFWMKGTLIPLTLIYIDEEYRIFQIINMEPEEKRRGGYRLFPSSKPSRYALEVPQDWMKGRSIKVGMKVDISSILNSPQ